eukprot:Skav205562  [mRNA]  locus=scaffold1407:33022:44938:- [translate_table: standard]
MLDDAQSLWFYERFPDDHFQKHELMKFPAGFRGFEVADWDGDRNLDLLLCHVPENLTGLASSVPLTVRFVNRSFLPATDTISFYEHLALLHTVGNTSVCRMQAVDFDNDGDLDLLMGNRHGIVRSTSMPRYFERRPTGLEERTGQQNPFSELSGSGVMQVADLDGDGGLDALAGFPRYVRLAPEVCGWLLMLYFRRTAAGSRANPPGGPMKMEFSCPHHDPGLLGLDMEPRVVDWNSDGLPDVIRMVPLDASEDGWKHSGGKWHLSLSQHFVDGELRRDSQVYRGLEMLKMLYFHYFTVVDDGFEDHIVILQSDDIDGQHIPLLVIKSLGGWSFSQRRVTYSYSLPKFHRFASEVFILVDWDRDGDLELLVPWVREGQGYFLAMSGLGENISDPFKNIKLKHRDKPLVVDWDNDGDLDLFLAPPDGRYFEQLADGSLYEWPSEQSPLVSAMKSLPPSSRRRGQYFQFVDCDKDGDEDLIYVSDDLALACEQDDETREFRCEADFLCLGADLNQYQGKRDRGRFEISALGGQLKLFAQQTDSGGIEASWQDSAYWICTFSNSQWHVKEELGNGNWQESSFYLALRSPHCKGTTMVIDELVLPLRRIWCLFEVYQTILLSRNDAFEGLLLCTSSGVLQQGNAGTDVAVAVANTVANLDTRTAEASNQSDRLMIQSLIESMPGGFDKMNSFVRETICKALDASHLHYETTRQNLMQTLSSTVAPPPPGPTLLTSRAPQTEAKAECTTQ